MNRIKWPEIQGLLNNRAAAAVLMALLLAASSFHKIIRYENLPGFNPASETGQFYSEGAFQYRYAKMTAEGRPIPILDRQAEWPEGIEPVKELTIFMEPVHGVCFRFFKVFFPSLPFHVFAVIFISCFTSLTILALYFGLRCFRVDRFTTLLCAAFYAFTGAVFDRIESYELEYFAFPFICFSFVFFVQALKNKRARAALSILTCLCLITALSSWHFTRFYLMVFVASAILSFFIMKQDDSRALAAPFSGVVAAIVVSGLLCPAMRRTGLLLSPPALAAYCFFIAMIIRRFIKFNLTAKAVMALSGAVLTALLIALIPHPGEKEYNQVWDLARLKLQTFGIKPSDPSGMPFDALVSWQGPFNTITPDRVLAAFGLFLPVSIMGIILTARKAVSRIDGPSLLLLPMALSFAAANYFFERLTIFSAFFAGLCLCGLFFPPLAPDENERGISVFRLKPVPAVMLAACLVIQLYQGIFYENNVFDRIMEGLNMAKGADENISRRKDMLELLEWITNRTAPSSVFLSGIELSPLVLTYAGRAINIHPKFESVKIRDKYRYFLKTYFGGDEKEFEKMTGRFESDYLVFSANNVLASGPDSMRYTACMLKLPTNSLAYRFHFHPEGFSNYDLVFRNGSCQVYRARKTNGPARAGRLPYFPIYDEALFNPEGSGGGGYFYENNSARVIMRIRYPYLALDEAARLARSGRYGGAVSLIEDAFTNGLPDADACYFGARLLFEIGEKDGAVELARKAAALDPDSFRNGLLLAQLFFMTDDLENSLKEFLSLSGKRPDDNGILTAIGRIYLKQGNKEKAEQYFKKALEAGKK